MSPLRFSSSRLKANIKRNQAKNAPKGGWIRKVDRKSNVTSTWLNGFSVFRYLIIWNDGAWVTNSFPEIERTHQSCQFWSILCQCSLAVFFSLRQSVVTVTFYDSLCSWNISTVRAVTLWTKGKTHNRCLATWRVKALSRVDATWEKKVLEDTGSISSVI